MLQRITCFDGNSRGPGNVITPGRHYLKAHVSLGISQGESNPLWFDAVAGQAYQVSTEIQMGSVGYGSFRVWMSNLATGQPVGGLVGTETPVPGGPAKC